MIEFIGLVECLAAVREYSVAVPPSEVAHTCPVPTTRHPEGRPLTTVDVKLACSAENGIVELRLDRNKSCCRSHSSSSCRSSCCCCCLGGALRVVLFVHWVELLAAVCAIAVAVVPRVAANAQAHCAAFHPENVPVATIAISLTGTAQQRLFPLRSRNNNRAIGRKCLARLVAIV